MTGDFEAAQRRRGDDRDRQTQTGHIPLPGQTVRLARRLGFRLAGAEAVVVELGTSLLNGHQFAADFGGDHGVLCLDLDDVEET